MRYHDKDEIGAPLSRLSTLPRQTKRLIMVVADATFIPVALWSAIALRYGEPFPAAALQWWLYPLALIGAIPVFARLGLYRSVVRFMGTRVVYSVVMGIAVAATLITLVTHLSSQQGVPLSVLTIFCSLALILVAGSRYAVRIYLQSQRRPGDRVAIYGAGGAGARLSSALIGGQEFLPVAFVDDNPALHGSVINGIEVHPPSSLPHLIDDLRISRVLLALPSVTRRKRQKILRRLESLAVHVQTMPNFSDLIAGVARVDELLEVDVADLLGRDSVPPNDNLLRACIQGKNVLVTGAGGSIGSELCRQILRLSPRSLLLVEMSEPALYQIDRELRLAVERDGLDVRIEALLGSVSRRERMREMMRTFGVHTVYHAAAYKHVPLVEQNMVEGVFNNVFGTLFTAQAAASANVETFVLVSTDKAVCPTNVMGASKRLSEMVLQSMHERGSTTRFCMVRFGNVLESSGSVVPLFREQIRRGGPVTVTHPKIIRYFMTIPEAAQLVIQAGSMSRGGDVFVLDMGNPVRIADLANRMIHLMGLTVMNKDNPEGDVEIRYTGLRPAEKLYEELLIGDNVMGTEHPSIMRAEEDFMAWPALEELLEHLTRAAADYDCEKVRSILLRSVTGYQPAREFSDVIWQERLTPAPVSDQKVTVLASKRLQ